MADFSYPPAVLNPNSGEVALNMKQIVEDNTADARRRTSNNGTSDRMWDAFNYNVAQDNHTARHLAQLNVIAAAQVGVTETQQTTSPVRTGSGDAIVGSEGVSADTAATANAAIAASLGNLASALVPIITAAGGVVTAQTLAALLPTVIAAAGSSAQNATGKPANPSA
jgi:hypothetical protein